MTVVLLVFVFLVDMMHCCTSFIATPGSTKDGDTIITYNSDGFTSYCDLYLSVAQDWPPGTKILNKIPQVNHTYNVVGLTNEKQVSFGETTWNNMRPELLNQAGALISYWDLMWITLQRSATAREVIMNIWSLLDEWGYDSTGETFSISDKNEAWIMDIVGKGNYSFGAVFVARRVPDGYVTGHANQARVRTFPLNDIDNCIYHQDTIQFARDRGWYEGKDEDFSFSDVYSPVNFESARWCEARVYDMFNKVTPKGTMDRYLDYVQGVNLTNRLPLWVKPEKKIDGVLDVFKVIRSHYEGTWFGMVGTFDVGNQPFFNGDRYNPLKWKASNGKTYVFERPISIQKTAMAFVMVNRAYMPDGIGTINWFSLDDTMTNVYVPFFSALQEVPDGYGDFGAEFSYDSVFWMLNLISNWAYYQYNHISADIKVKQGELESRYVNEIVKEVDVIGKDIYEIYGQEKMYEYLSNYSVSTANEFLGTWKGFFGTLFQKYYDSAKYNKGYNIEWYDHIVEKTGDHFLYRGNDPL